MNTTNARNTPILGPLGCQEVVTPGTPTLLSDLVAIPHDAYSAWVQGVGGDMLFSLNASTAGAAGLSAQDLRLSTPAAIRRCVIKAGTATGIVVQFYTGNSGL